MRLVLLPLALAAASAQSQTPAPAPAPAYDFSQSVPATGAWTYRAEGGGSDAVFVDTRGFSRLTMRCDRSARRVSITVTHPAVTGAVAVWTSSETRSLAARFDQAAGQVIADVAVNDALLDGIAFSRGRFAVVIAGAVPLVLPADAEPARVVEDCRN